MDSHLEQLLTRRRFLELTRTGIGTAALATLFGQDLLAQAPGGVPTAIGGLAGLPHHAPKAKRVIYLFQSGAPSQHELWDYKPALQDMVGEDLPSSVRGDQRVTTMTAGQESFPLVPSKFMFAQHGESRTWVSDLMPYTAKIVDELCFIRSMHTEAINHDPGITFFQTGAQLAGRPSMGAWLSYGLGTMNSDLPTFVAMVSKGSAQTGQPLYDRLWGSGFLPTRYQGVKFLSTGDPVLYLSNPPGVDPDTRRRFLDDLGALNQLKEAEFGDPETTTRIAQYEMAFRMQASIPEVTDISGEPEHVLREYGDDVKNPGTFAANCLQARRLAERGVRFIQVYSGGNHNDANWDAHGDLEKNHNYHAGNTDQPVAALLEDLQERGLLDETLVIWGGEFGRQPTAEYAKGTGRDHNSYGFTMWMAGGGIKGGVSVGKTDELGAAAVEKPFHVRRLHATVLKQLGFDPNELSYFYRGLDQRLVGVEGAEPIHEIIA